MFRGNVETYVPLSAKLCGPIYLANAIGIRVAELRNALDYRAIPGGFPVPECSLVVSPSCLSPFSNESNEREPAISFIRMGHVDEGIPPNKVNVLLIPSFLETFYPKNCSEKKVSIMRN